MNDIPNEDVLDKRCRKTRKAIKTSLVKLMSEKDISNITITEIAEDADINRKTFYAHYKDLYDILDEIENDMIKQLFHILDHADIMKIMYNPYPLLKELTTELYRDFEFHKLLIQSENYNNLLKKIQSVFKDRIMELTEDIVKIDRDIFSFMIDFVTSGIISAYREWFRSDRNISLEQLTKSLSVLIENGFHALSESKA